MQKKITFFLIIDYKILTTSISRVGAFICKKATNFDPLTKNLHKNLESENNCLSYSQNASQKRNTKTF